MNYFVDGYNLLFHLFGGFSTLQQERELLLQELDSLIQKTALNVTIVFDAHLRREQMTRLKFHSLDIVFTDFEQTADDYILELLSFCAQPKQKIVVTNDQRLAWKARSFGAKTQSLSLFLNQLEKAAKQEKKEKRDKKPLPLPTPEVQLGDFPGSIEYYLKIFEENDQKNKKK